MSAREILSLQLGHYANFIGTHWWNIQENGFDYSGATQSEINHDVLYREGLTDKGEVTFTPRLLLVDLKGSLRTLPERGELYEGPTDPAVTTVKWPDNAVEVIAEDKPPKNTYQKLLQSNENVDFLPSDSLNNEVNVWSDYLYSRFHPRTVNIIKEYQHGSEGAVFDVFPLGRNFWGNVEFKEDFCDKVRSYVEECDNLQGFHLTLDAVNGFGGLGSSCLDHLNDEYYKKTVLTFASIPSWYNDYNYTNAEEREESSRKDSVRLINLAFCLTSLSEDGSLTVPICTGGKGWRQPGDRRHFKYIQYNAQLAYHTSAILATALETLTMPYRLNTAKYNMSDFCADLSGRGRKIAAASLNLPFPMRKKVDFIDCLDNWEGPLWQSVTPGCEIGTDKVFQLVSLRGVPEAKLKRAVHEAKRQRAMPAYKCESVQEMLSFYLSCTSYATATYVTTVPSALSVTTPFPNIFDQYVGVDGDILDVPKLTNEAVRSVPVLAGCHSSPGVGAMLESLHRETRRIKVGRLHQFKDAGLDEDEFKECFNKLLGLRECYEESFE